MHVARLLDSQYETLETLEPDENGVALGIEDPIEVIADRSAALVREVDAAVGAAGLSGCCGVRGCLSCLVSYGLFSYLP